MRKKNLQSFRSTFVLDKDGNIEKEWRNVKVKGHVDEVLAYLTGNNS